MRLIFTVGAIEFLKRPCSLNNHTVDTGKMKCLKCGMWGRLLYQFPCPTGFKMNDMFYQLPTFQMFTYNNHAFMKLKESKAFCFNNEQITDFIPDTVVVPIDSDELKLFKLRVERMVTDASLVRKIFSRKDIRRLKDCKPGTAFTDSVRRYTLLNNDDVDFCKAGPTKFKAMDSNYRVHEFDAQELMEVVD